LCSRPKKRCGTRLRMKRLPILVDELSARRRPVSGMTRSYGFPAESPNVDLEIQHRKGGQAMNNSAFEEDSPLVFIVDDDEEVRTAIGELMFSVGIEAACCASTRELTESPLLNRVGCIVLDVRMPGASGLDLQQHLASAGISKPIVFLTGHGDIPMSVQAMKAGAIDFLTKPVRDQTLLDAVTAGIERDFADRAHARAVQKHVEHYQTLTRRECQVMREVA